MNNHIADVRKKVQNTPTPWNWDNDLNGETFIYKSINPPYKNRLATMNIDEPMQYENAAFIVRAVNAYDSLISEIAVKDAVIKQLTEENNKLRKLTTPPGR